MKLLLQALLLTSVSVSITTANDDILKTPDSKSTVSEIGAPVKAARTATYSQTSTADKQLNFDDSDSDSDSDSDF